MQFSVVVETLNSQCVRFWGHSLANQAVHRSGVDKLVAIADNVWVTTVEDYELTCKCIRLYDGFYVAYAAGCAITTEWFAVAVRRFRS